jgi:hypothetical protein
MRPAVGVTLAALLGAESRVLSLASSGLDAPEW